MSRKVHLQQLTEWVNIEGLSGRGSQRTTKLGYNKNNLANWLPSEYLHGFIIWFAMGVTPRRPYMTRITATIMLILTTHLTKEYIWYLILYFPLYFFGQWKNPNTFGWFAITPHNSPCIAVFDIFTFLGIRSIRILSRILSVLPTPCWALLGAF